MTNMRGKIKRCGSLINGLSLMWANWHE